MAVGNSHRSVFVTMSFTTNKITPISSVCIRTVAVESSTDCTRTVVDEALQQRNHVENGKTLIMPDGTQTATHIAMHVTVYSSMYYRGSNNYTWFHTAITPNNSVQERFLQIEENVIGFCSSYSTVDNYERTVQTG